MSNKVQISGKIGTTKEFNTSSGKTITRFGLSFWNGKDKDGKSKYAFVNCIYFDRLEQTHGDVEIDGYISSEEWNDKETGKKRTSIVLNVKTIKPFEWKNSNVESENKVNDDDYADSSIDDECPF